MGRPQQQSREPTDEGCSLNKPLFPFKAHYFLLNAAHVGVIPYLPVYARSVLGCSAMTVGILATCMQLSSCLAKPLFGLLADYLKRMKGLMVILMAFEVVVNLLMLSLPPVDLISKEMPYHLPSESSHIWQLSPSRTYDAAIGLHKQPEIFRQDRNTPLLYNSSEIDITNSSHPLYFQALESRRRRRRDTTQRNITKCSLHCDKILDKAVCQRDSLCTDPRDNCLLPCVLYERKDMTFCRDLQKNSNFSLTYPVTTAQNFSNEFAFQPQSFVYFRKFNDYPSSCNFSLGTCKLSCKEQVPSLIETYQFWIFCLFALMGSMCQGALLTLSDTVCYDKIRGTTAEYGAQRLWGAVGWGMIAPLIGLLNDLATGGSIHEDYSSGWFIMAILSVFFLVNLFCMDFPETQQQSNMTDSVRVTVMSRQFLLMEVNVFFSGVLNAYASNYVLWYLESLGSSRIVMGLALGVDCLFGEAPFMYISSSVISLIGHWNVMTFMYAAYALRFGLYFFIHNPWLVLPVELLNGVTFGLFYTTMTSFAEEVSPGGAEATIQGLVGGTYSGFGTGVGCLIAGISFQKLGGHRSFLLAGICSAVLGLVHHIIYFFFKPRSHGYQRLGEQVGKP